MLSTIHAGEKRLCDATVPETTSEKRSKLDDTRSLSSVVTANAEGEEDTVLQIRLDLWCSPNGLFEADGLIGHDTVKPHNQNPNLKFHSNICKIFSSL